MRVLVSGFIGLMCIYSCLESIAFAAQKGGKSNPAKLAKAGAANPDQNPTPGASRGTTASLMTNSTSIASGMVMAAKYMPTDTLGQQSAHPIISLRQNKSNAQFDLGLGSYASNIKSGDNFETESTTSITHVGLGTTIVSTQGIRFGARIEIIDDPIKVKTKKPVESSRKVKFSGQDVSFFAAAGVTQNFGMSLNMTMADRKLGDDKESANLISPAVMGMFDQTEVIFDLAQANEDVAMDGHWRLSAIHKLESGTFMTGHLMRVKPNAGDDYWDIALGGRKKSSSLGSFGAEFLYSQQKDGTSGKCAVPALFGIRADVDHELTAAQLASLGAQYVTGSCSYDRIKETVDDLELKAAFTMIF